MATSILGRIKQIHKGTYNAGTAYKVDDIVEYTDTNIKGTYICTAASTGNAPSTGGTIHASWAYQSKSNLDTGLFKNATSMGSAGAAIKTNTGATAIEFGTLGGGAKIETKTADYTITNADLDGAIEYILTCNANPGHRTITLPALSSANLATVIISIVIDTDTAVSSGIGQYEVRVNQDAGDNSGAELWSGTRKNDFVRLIKMNNAWHIIDNKETYFERRYMASNQYIDGYAHEHLTSGGWTVYSSTLRNNELNYNSWGNCWNSGNNEFICPFDCWVDMNLQGAYPGEGNNDGLTSSWRVNGTTIYRHHARHSDGRICGPDGTVRTVMPATAGWDIEPWCQNIDDNGGPTYGGYTGEVCNLFISAWRRYW